MLPSFGASLIFLVVPLTLHLIQSCGAADGITTNDPYYKQCSTSGNFSNDNSPYQLNLAQLLATLPSNAINNSGYFNGTAGSAPDAVFGLVMCQADIPWPDQCKSCLQAATAGVNAACPSSKNASIGNPGCLLRYSDTPIAGIPNDDIAFDTLSHGANVLQIVPFQRTRRDLFTALSAAASVSPMLLASGNRTYNSSHTLYGLAQCSRDLQGDDCSKCITSLVTNIPIKVIWSEGVSVTGFSCYIRYDLTPFAIYGLGTNITGPSEIIVVKGRSIHGGEIAAISVCISIIILLVVFIAVWRYQKKRKMEELLQITKLRYYTYHEIKSGTQNFSNSLGKGGFGQVYKANLRVGENKTEELAVKCVTNPDAAKGLLNELVLLARLKHVNLVELVGFCNDDGWPYFGKNGRKLYVCNKLLSNGSLEKYLSENRSTTPNNTQQQEDLKAKLSWPIRYKIIRGICDGLHYLHRECADTVSHMDIKPSNILLDKSMVPKIADFGISRVLVNKTHTMTSRLIGTGGYMAPEYVNGKGKRIVGHRCDIYSLGVLILVIIVGNEPCNADTSGMMFINKIREELESLKEMEERLKMYASLEDGDSLEEVKKCIGLAFRCVDIERDARPTAEDIVSSLRLNNI